MNIEQLVPFKVSIIEPPSAEEVVKMRLSSNYHSLKGNEDFRCANLARNIYDIVKNKEWTVSGIVDFGEITTFLLIHPGEITQFYPAKYCVVEN
jgi:hypothetical protein